MVGVGSEHDRGVSQLVLDELQVRARLQREAGCAVPQVVQTHRWEPAGGDEFAEVDRQTVWADRPAADVGED